MTKPTKPQTPPAVPEGGGSYIRRKDGSLERVEGTEPAPPFQRSREALSKPVEGDA